MKDISPARLATITAACIALVALGYLCFLAATWVQFQSDRNLRMEKIDELLDRIPKPASDAAGSEADAATGKVLRLRDANKEASSTVPDPIRNKAGDVLREMPEQTPETSPDRNQDI